MGASSRTSLSLLIRRVYLFQDSDLFSNPILRHNNMVLPRLSHWHDSDLGWFQLQMPGWIRRHP